MRCCRRIWSNIVAAASTHHQFDASRIGEESGLLRFRKHPAKRKLGKPTFLFSVPAAHVAMHPREPNLLHIYRSSAGWRWMPKVGAEESAPFIDCDGVP